MTTEQSDGACAPSFSSAELERLAIEAGVLPVARVVAGMTPLWWSVTADNLRRFAELVAKAEREECANVCLEVAEEGAGMAGEVWAGRCADAIRERSNA